MKTHTWPTATELADSVRRGERTATELLDTALAAIETLNPALNAWVQLDPDGAREAAAAVDAAVARGEDPGPFAGVPLAVKDLEDLRGLPMREGSLLFRDAPPASRDSVHVARLRAAGAVPLGKTTVPEFGFTAQTTTKAHGVTRNPWSLDTTPGGSSGGSATAVAAGMVPLATASDGGGSTRIPASYSGLVGLKPSHGRIPCVKSGDTAVMGALSVSVVDAARHLDVVAGPDGSDHQSLPAPGVRYVEAIESLDLSGLRAAWSPDLGWAAVDDEVMAITDAAMREVAQAAGLRLVDRPVRLPNAVPGWAVKAATAYLERLSYLGFWPDRRDDLDDITRLVVQMRERFGPAHTYRAEERRRQVIAATAELFGDVDVLFTPTTAMTAPPAVGPPPEVIGGRDARLSGPAPFTQFVNFAWNPAISVPAGVTRAGMPVGLQIVGPRHADEVCLRLARLLELQRPWQRRPEALRGDVAAAATAPEGVAGELDVDELAAYLEWALDLSHDATVLPDEFALP